MESGEKLRAIPDVYGNSIVVSPNGRRVAVGYDMGKFDLWDLKNGHRCSNEDGRTSGRPTGLLPPRAAYFQPRLSFIQLLGPAKTGRRPESMETPGAYDLEDLRRRFSPDGRDAASFSGEGKNFQAILWDVVKRRR